MRIISKGFTIVELIIVIVVIGILAGVTIVSYNGVQSRAEYAKASSDLLHINDALTVYHAQNGSYPVSQNQFANFEFQYFGSSNVNTNFLASLVPTYLDTMPIGTYQKGGTTFTYGYRSDGTNYKLIRQATPSLPSVEQNNTLSDPARPTTAWGYWTPGAAAW